MDWNALKVFLAIAGNGSLAGAARELGVNHSTVFRRLNSFEQAIGGRLFERLGQGYRLTSLGEELLGAAQDIGASFDDLERHIIGKDFQPRGLVKITAPNNIAYRYLPRYLADFNRQYPDIRLEILASNLEFNMNNRQADIAVRATPSPPQHLVGRLLRVIKWGVYGSPAYGRDTELPRTLDELATHRLIGAAGDMRQLPGFVWLEKNLADQIHSCCDDLVTMSYLAESGQGLAVLPDDQQRAGIVRLFDFEPGGTSDLWLLTHPDLRHVERIRRVMQFLTSAFAAEPLL